MGIAFLALPSCYALGPDVCGPEDQKANIEAVTLAKSPRPISPRSADSVAVVVTPPDYPFVEIALLEARQRRPDCGDRTDVVEALRSTAAEMGCDLLIIYGGNDATFSYPYREHYTLNGYRATCGVYYGPSKRSAARTTTSHAMTAYPPTR